MTIPPPMLALIALRDVGVVRVAFDHPGYTELWERHLAMVGIVVGNDDALEFRLTDAGRAVAATISTEVSP